MRMPNPNFSWEKQKQWNVGMELTTLDNRLTAGVEVYKKNTLRPDLLQLPGTAADRLLQPGVCREYR